MTNNWVQKEKEKIKKDSRDIPMAYLDRFFNLYNQVISFNYHFVVFLGLLGGFGFTLYTSNKVVSTFLFVLGEFLILFIDFITLMRTKAYYTSEALSLFESQNKRLMFFRDIKALLNDAEKLNIQEDTYRKFVSMLNDRTFKNDNPSNISQLVKNTLPKHHIFMSFLGIIFVILSLFIDMKAVIEFFLKMIQY